MNNIKSLKLTAGLSVFLILFVIVSFGAMGAMGPSIKLNVTVIKTEPVPLQTGEYADIWVKLVNEGDMAAEGTKFEIIPEFPFSADPDEDLTRDFGKMVPGMEYYTHFQLKVDENAVQGTNELKFRHSTTNGVTITKTVPIQVRTDDAALLVKDVSLESGSTTVAPSKTEEVDITLENVADSYLKNIDVSLDISSSDLPLITVGSTTGKRVQKIAPGKTASVSFNLKADSDADQKAYKVPLKVEYENEAGTDFSKKEYTGIIVGGKPELETNIAEIQGGYMMPGTSKDVSISLVNRGLSVAKFVSLEVLSGNNYRIISPSKIYIGNMESDDYESSDFNIYVERGTEGITLPLRLNYKDSEGSSIVENETVSFDTYTSGEVSKFKLEKGNNTIYFVIIIAVVLVVGYYLYRKRKSKESAILEEE